MEPPSRLNPRRILPGCEPGWAAMGIVEIGLVVAAVAFTTGLLAINVL